VEDLAVEPVLADGDQDRRAGLGETIDRRGRMSALPIPVPMVMANTRCFPGSHAEPGLCDSGR
jgi:hypothetical protein